MLNLSHLSFDLGGPQKALALESTSTSGLDATFDNLIGHTTEKAQQAVFSLSPLPSRWTLGVRSAERLSRLCQFLFSTCGSRAARTHPPLHDPLPQIKSLVYLALKLSYGISCSENREEQFRKYQNHYLSELEASVADIEDPGAIGSAERDMQAISTSYNAIDHVTQPNLGRITSAIKLPERVRRANIGPEKSRRTRMLLSFESARRRWGQGRTNKVSIGQKQLHFVPLIPSGVCIIALHNRVGIENACVGDASIQVICCCAHIINHTTITHQAGLHIVGGYRRPASSMQSSKVD
ncbi:hypothetical protein DFH06DRAFT_1353861 [Mycena polygramma]|nr:hypothetical protein DFH06DRAFT_1353861 [Mycena polygramma]